MKYNSNRLHLYGSQAAIRAINDGSGDDKNNLSTSNQRCSPTINYQIIVKPLKMLSRIQDSFYEVSPPLRLSSYYGRGGRPSVSPSIVFRLDFLRNTTFQKPIQIGKRTKCA